MIHHTEGPWEAVNYSGYWTVRRVDADKNEADVTDTKDDKVYLMEGDAKLIAVAPDMRDILNFFARSGAHSQDNPVPDVNIPTALIDAWVDKARATLAKAGVE